MNDLENEVDGIIPSLLSTSHCSLRTEEAISKYVFEGFKENLEEMREGKVRNAMSVFVLGAVGRGRLTRTVARERSKKMRNAKSTSK